MLSAGLPVTIPALQEARIMNRKDLISAVSSKADVTKTQADRIVGSVLEAVMETLRKQGKMVIHGLGTFVASSRAERKGINPATKEPMIIPACVVPGFRAA